MRKLLLILALFVTASAVKAQTPITSVTAIKFVTVAPDAKVTCNDPTVLYILASVGFFQCSANTSHYVPVQVSWTTTIISSVITTPPAGGGTTTDTLTLNLTEDQYQGDALFSLTFDGTVLEQSKAVTVPNCGQYAIPTACSGQQFVYNGNWGSAGPHTVVITFLNDLYGGSSTTDRNLYVNGVTYDGVSLTTTGTYNGYTIKNNRTNNYLTLSSGVLITGVLPTTWNLNGISPTPAPGGATLASGSYSITSGSNSVDGGFGFFSQSPRVQIYASDTTNANGYQQWTWNGSTLANVKYTGQFLIDSSATANVAGNASEGTSSDNWTITGVLANGLASLQNTGQAFTFQVGTAVGTSTPPVSPITTPSNVVPSYTIPAIPSSGTHNLKTDYGAVGDGSTNDASHWAAALSTGGNIIVPAGTYLINTGASNNVSGTSIWCQGGATIKDTSSATPAYAIYAQNSNFAVYNCNFVGAGIELQGSVNNNVNIAGNTFSNITNSGDGIHVDGTLGTNSWIDNNQFNSIYSGLVNGIPQWDTGSQGNGFFALGFLNTVQITNNTCQKISYDCIKGFFNQNAPAATGFLLAGNKATQVHRIGFEFQDCSSNSNGCFAGTTGSSAGAIFKDNFFSDPWYGDKGTFAFSFPVDHSATNRIFNNTAILNYACCLTGSGVWTGYGIETSGNNDQVYNNVISASSATQGTNNLAGWGDPIGFDNSNAGVAYNNYLCGADSKITQGGTQANGVVFPTNNIVRNNFISTSPCPYPDSAMTQSSLTVTFTGSQTVSVSSRLSVMSVEFDLDGSKSNIQEIGTENTNFSSDPRWTFTGGINTSGLANGSHTITAIATDVLGKTASASSIITVGAVAGTRGRVQISGKSVLADDGQPLRFISSHIHDNQFNGYLSQDAWWKQVKNIGHFNGVRVMAYYGSWPNSPQVMDTTTLVNRLKVAEGLAAANKMYLLIDNHSTCCGNTNLSNATTFWNAVAPVFKNNTEVIYEAQNEPYQYDTTGYPAFENSLYTLIRGQAPNTHIIMWTIENLLDQSIGAITSYLAAGTSISYANASVGFHMYDTIKTQTWTTGISGLQTYINTIKATYPVFMTEFGVNTAQSPQDQSILPILDTLGVSWVWLDGTGFELSSSQVYGLGPANPISVYWTLDPSSVRMQLFPPVYTFASNKKTVVDLRRFR